MKAGPLWKKISSDDHLGMNQLDAEEWQYDIKSHRSPVHHKLLPLLLWVLEV